jgi:class 3 adenylate cyclase
MTERLGSVECAKVVQRHRDVLLPVIERHGGKGKPTGGDGLVAAFDSADSAVMAAIEMQEAIERLGSEVSIPESLAVRIGIASGEVVVDTGGRPFLGAALNLAARVMGLADGGRIFLSGDVAHALAGGFVLHSHGERELKNIGRPVEVVEVLWKAEMAPQVIESGSERTETPRPMSGPAA